MRLSNSLEQTGNSAKIELLVTTSCQLVVDQTENVPFNQWKSLIFQVKRSYSKPFYWSSFSDSSDRVKATNSIPVWLLTCFSGLRALRGQGLDGGELEVCLRLGQRDIHAPHLRGPNLHGQQVGLGWLRMENLHFNKRWSFPEWLLFLDIFFLVLMIWQLGVLVYRQCTL